MAASDFTTGPGGEPIWTGWKDLKPGDRVESIAGMGGTVVAFPKARPGRTMVEMVKHVGMTVRWDNGHEGRVTRPGHNLRPEGSTT